MNYTKQYRVEQYRVMWENEDYILNFTEPQAASIGAILTEDGLPVVTALKLVDKWNREAHAMGSKNIYTVIQ